MHILQLGRSDEGVVLSTIRHSSSGKGRRKGRASGPPAAMSGTPSEQPPYTANVATAGPSQPSPTAVATESIPRLSPQDRTHLLDRATRSPIGLGKMRRGVSVFQPLHVASVATISGDSS